MTSTKQFEVGKTYSTRSICDSDCIYSFTITARTAKTITTTVWGKTVRRGLSVYNGVEQFKPHGTHSMCAVISAEKGIPVYSYDVGTRDGFGHVDTFGAIAAISLADFEHRNKAGRGSVEYIAGLVAAMVGVDLSGEVQS